MIDEMRKKSDIYRLWMNSCWTNSNSPFFVHNPIISWITQSSISIDGSQRRMWLKCVESEYESEEWLRAKHWWSVKRWKKRWNESYSLSLYHHNLCAMKSMLKWIWGDYGIEWMRKRREWDEYE